MNRLLYMSWFWYAMAWMQLLAGVLRDRPVNLVIAALNFLIFIGLLWESKR